MSILLEHGHLIVDGNREYLDGALLIENETIREVYPQTAKIKNPTEDCTRIDLGGLLVMPGFFDSHSHGIAGMSFDYADKEDMDRISYEFSKDGTTSFLASLSYDLDIEGFKRQLCRFEEEKGIYARFEGFHLEGPFLSRKHIGVGDGSRFVKPDLSLAEELLSCSSRIRQMTIAYEEDGAKEIGKLLKSKNIKVMCGHSDALIGDLDENVDGFTHLFNAMRGLHHRDVTLVNCAFMNRWPFELIADGNHVRENVLKLLVNNVDRDKIMLVSDSSIARGLPDGEYEFMSMKCIKKGTTFITDDGHFAGSVVSLNDEMKLFYRLGVKYTDLLLYASLNPFRFYGLDQRFGTIEKGKAADLVIMDDDLNIQDVYIRGGSIHV